MFILMFGMPAPTGDPEKPAEPEMLGMFMCTDLREGKGDARERVIKAVYEYTAIRFVHVDPDGTLNQHQLTGPEFEVDIKAAVIDRDGNMVKMSDDPPVFDLGGV